MANCYLFVDQQSYVLGTAELSDNAVDMAHDLAAETGDVITCYRVTLVTVATPPREANEPAEEERP